MRRLKLSKMLDTLPERLALARQQKMPHQDLLLLVLSEEATRRDGLAASLRARRGHLDPDMQLERWDPTAKVTFDKALWNEITSLRFIESHNHVAILGPVGVGKTLLAHALGHAACRRGLSVLALRADQMLKTLKHARLDNTHEQELRKLIAVDLLIIDDAGLDAMDATESRDLYEIFTERHRAGSMVLTSNRSSDEWLATFADPVRARALSTASPATPTTLSSKASRRPIANAISARVEDLVEQARKLRPRRGENAAQAFDQTARLD
jgi:DNA replication protein DnaC